MSAGQHRRPAGARGRATHAHTWTNKTFIDELSERLLLGKVIERPEHVAELTVNEEHFNGDRRTVFRAIAFLSEHGRPIDVATLAEPLRAQGVTSTALVEEMLIEARENPASLRELERNLHALLRRRQLHNQAKACADAALDPTVTSAAFEDLAHETSATLARLAADTQDTAQHGAGTVPWVRLDTVQPETVRWLWAQRIPLGKVTILEGDPDEGKSTVAFDLAARVTTGAAMPFDPTPREPGGVVILSAEDGLADTIVPRLIAAGADLARVVAFRMDALPTIPGELEKIEQAIGDIGAVFVIIDPLMAFLAGTVDSHRDQDVRRALLPLAALAERTGIAALTIRHLNKASGGPAKHRGGGSIGIIGAARSTLLVARDPEDDARRVIAPVKNNLSAPPVALSFSLVPAGAVVRVAWHGETPQTADALLARPAGPEERGAVDEAIDILRDVLADGPMKAEDVERARKRVNISDWAWRQARVRLRVHVGRAGFGRGGYWTWTLPIDAGPRGTTPYDPPGNGTGEKGPGNPIDDGQPIDGGRGDDTATAAYGCAAEHAELLSLAAARGFPEVRLDQARTVRAGEDAWQRFARNPTPDDRAAVLMILRGAPS